MATTPTNTDTDATHILANDHRKVEKLFAGFESASGRDQKARIAEQICNELKIHTIIEEEIFYPALEGKIDEDLLRKPMLSMTVRSCSSTKSPRAIRTRNSSTPR